MLAVNSVSWGYKIDERYPGIYLDSMELQIVVGLLRSKTREKIVEDLEISSRTFDYYCYRLLKLLGHYNLTDLVAALRETELCKHIAL